MRLPFCKCKLRPLLVLVLGWALAAGPAAGAATTDAPQKSQIKGAVWLWSRLQDLQSVCPGVADEGWRLERLGKATSSETHFSAIGYLKELNAQPGWQEGLANDVRMIVKGAGGCGTDALREWIAEARRVLDTTTQYVSGDVATHWPAPVLLAPVKIEIEGMEVVDDKDPGTLRVSIHNPGPGAAGVALSGKDLRAGLCSTITSPDIPVTVATDAPDRLLIVQPGETKAVALILDEECFAQTTGSLSGAVVIVRNEVVEYRALLQLGVSRTRPAASKASGRVNAASAGP